MGFRMIAPKGCANLPHAQHSPLGVSESRFRSCHSDASVGRAFCEVWSIIKERTGVTVGAQSREEPVPTGGLVLLMTQRFSKG